MITDRICEFIYHSVLYLGTKLFTCNYLVYLKVMFKLFRHLCLLTGRQLSRHQDRDFSLPQSGASCEGSTIPKHQLFLLMKSKSSSCPLNITSCGDFNPIICININPFSPCGKKSSSPRSGLSAVFYFCARTSKVTKSPTLQKAFCEVSNSVMQDLQILGV